MRSGTFFTRMGTLQAGLCLALALVSPMASRGQDVSSRKLPVISQESTSAEPTQNAGNGAGDEVKASAPADAAQDPAGDGESSFWSKVPPVAPLPRAGVFLVL